MRARLGWQRQAPACRWLTHWPLAPLCWLSATLSLRGAPRRSNLNAANWLCFARREREVRSVKSEVRELSVCGLSGLTLETSNLKLLNWLCFYGRFPAPIPYNPFPCRHLSPIAAPANWVCSTHFSRGGPAELGSFCTFRPRRPRPSAPIPGRSGQIGFVWRDGPQFVVTP
jgi:hypothetical protein